MRTGSVFVFKNAYLFFLFRYPKTNQNKIVLPIIIQIRSCDPDVVLFVCVSLKKKKNRVSVGHNVSGRDTTLGSNDEDRHGLRFVRKVSPVGPSVPDSHLRGPSDSRETESNRHRNR